MSQKRMHCYSLKFIENIFDYKKICVLLQPELNNINKAVPEFIPSVIRSRKIRAAK